MYTAASISGVRAATLVMEPKTLRIPVTATKSGNTLETTWLPLPRTFATLVSRSNPARKRGGAARLVPANGEPTKIILPTLDRSFSNASSHHRTTRPPRLWQITSILASVDESSRDKSMALPRSSDGRRIGSDHNDVWHSRRTSYHRRFHSGHP